MIRAGFAIISLLMVVAITGAILSRVSPASLSPIEVIDGDTVRFEGKTVRLVGFDMPELGSHARCGLERILAARAASRLRQIIAPGDARLEIVPCSCRSGTEGTMACNYGRACGVLTVADRDVGFTLIEENLAHRYVCDHTRCPARETWCPSDRP